MNAIFKWIPVMIILWPLTSLSAVSPSSSNPATTNPNTSTPAPYTHISTKTPRPPSQPATFSNALNAWAEQRRCLANQRAQHTRVTPALADACKRPLLTNPKNSSNANTSSATTQKNPNMKL